MPNASKCKESKCLRSIGTHELVLSHKNSAKLNKWQRLFTCSDLAYLSFAPIQCLANNWSELVQSDATKLPWIPHCLLEAPEEM